MAYDALRESITLIETRDVGGAARLSRRRRFIPLAVDVEDDVAVTVFLRRGVGSAELEMHLLARRSATWRVLGGGGGSDDLDEITRAQTRGQLGCFGEVNGGTAIFVDEDRGWHQRRKSVRSAWLRVAVEVAAVEFNGRRITVPWHHHVALVWTGDEASPTALISAEGTVLSRLDVG